MNYRSALFFFFYGGHGLPSRVFFLHSKSDILKWLPTFSSLIFFCFSLLLIYHIPGSIGSVHRHFSPFRLPLPLEDSAVARRCLNRRSPDLRPTCFLFSYFPSYPDLPPRIILRSLLYLLSGPMLYPTVSAVVPIPSLVVHFSRIPRVPFFSSSSQSALEVRASCFGWLIFYFLSNHLTFTVMLWIISACLPVYPDCSLDFFNLWSLFLFMTFSGEILELEMDSMKPVISNLPWAALLAARDFCQ